MIQRALEFSLVTLLYENQEFVQCQYSKLFQVCLGEVASRATAVQTSLSYLCSVGQEDGRGQVACDATEHVDDGDSQPARQLLDVPQHCHLEKHRHQAVKDPTHSQKNEFIFTRYLKTSEAIRHHKTEVSHPA